MNTALQKTLSKTPANLYAGLGSAFIQLADEKLTTQGRMAFVLPATALTGSRWREIRRLLLRNFSIDWVIVSHDLRSRSATKGLPGRLHTSFSESTRMAETLIVATKDPNGMRRNSVRFVNLTRNPDDPVQAMTLTRKLLAMDEISTSLDSVAVDIGGMSWGSLLKIPQKALNDEGWQFTAFTQGELALTAVSKGSLLLDSQNSIPTIELGKLADLGPYHMQIKNPDQGLFYIVETEERLRSGIPVLWHHNSLKFTTLESKSNARLERRKDRDRTAQDRMLDRQSRLQLASEIRMASQKVAAVLTVKPMLGVRSWITVQLRSPAPGKEEALCLWLNSTLGLLFRIVHGNRPYLGRSALPHELARTLPVLDINKPSTEQLKASVAIYRQLKSKDLQSFGCIRNDPVREELNSLLFDEVLDVGPSIVAEITDRLSLEPTIKART